MFNKRDNISSTIRSVLNQNYLPGEIIIVNDGSTDGSEEIVRQFNHPLIRLVNQANAGVSVARNYGISLAKNNWLAFIDADDLWDASFLDEMNVLSENFPSARVLACAYKLQVASGGVSNIKLRGIPFSGEVGLLNNYFKVASVSSPPICASAVIVNKSALEEIKGFPIGIKSGEDLLTWARLAANNDIAYSLNPLATFILAPSHDYSEEPNRIPEANDRVVLGLIELGADAPRTKYLRRYIAFWKKTRAQAYLRLGFRKQSFIESLKSIIYYPGNIVVFFYIGALILPKSIVNKIFKRYRG